MSNHWKNSQDVIKWFRDTPNKKAHTFITFDICDFYPSITEELLDKALDFASYHTEVTKDDKVIIKHTKKKKLLSSAKTYPGVNQVQTLMSQWAVSMVQKRANW